MEHVNIPLGEIHPPHNWQWADEAARLAEVVTDATLVDRVGLQVSDGTLWRLSAVVPAVVWEPVAQVVPWAGVTGKPETFTPSAHGHSVADVAGLQAALDGKQPTGSYIVEGDARLADARPASDVSAWAKAASKPTYTAAEVGAATADHSHAAATTSTAGFMSATDKTKLDGVEAGANAYTHPTSHPASIITQDANNRFVSDTEKATWGGKQDAITAGTTSQYWRGDKSWRDFFTDVRAATLTGLSTATNAVVIATDTVLGALGKLQKQVSDNLTTLTSHTGNSSNPHSVTKAQVGLGNVDNTSDASKPVSTATQTALNLKANSATTVEQSDIGTGPDEIPLNQHLGDMAFQNANALVIKPAASATPQQVGSMVFQLTSDTQLVVKVKGSDGTVRSATLTLA